LTARALSRGINPGTLVLAAAVPLVFLHPQYQPSFHLVGTATVDLSDLAVLAAFVATLLAAGRLRLEPLTRTPWLWAVAAFLLVVIVVSTLYGRATDSRYLLGTHAVTAAKWIEYSTLALAAAYLARTRAELRILLGAFVAWSVAMTTVAVLQFFGAVAEFQGLRPGQREPSYVGIHDFAALSGGALSLAFAALAFGAPDRLDRGVAWTAGISGAIGVALSGSVFALSGIALAALAAVLAQWRLGRLAPRRAAAMGAIVAAVGLGVFGLRAHNVEQFLSFLGVNVHKKEDLAGSSGAHRTVLAYIGGRIFVANPVFGVGWQGSAYEENFGPYLAAARRRFPSVDPYDLPSPQHRWGVQNAYIQAAADLGVVGFAAFVALLVAALAAAWRGVGRTRVAFGLVPLLWLLVAIGIWNALGLYAGIPLEGFTWLGVGLAAVAGD
jgi:O-antigen ligase